MSHITSAHDGLAAVGNKDWETAITKLSSALDQSQNPSWLISRSKAFIGLGRFEEALADAEVAWHVAFSRSSRPDMLEAQYRRAVAYYRLGKLADADCCCVYAMRLAKGFPAVEEKDPKLEWMDDQGRWLARLETVVEESRTDSFNVGDASKEKGDLTSLVHMKGPHVQPWRQAGLLRMQILRALEALPENDEARVVRTSLKPDDKSYKSVPSKASVPKTTSTETGPSEITPPRMQEFQTPNTMTVSIFSKGVNPNSLAVGFLTSAVRLDPILYPDGEWRALCLSLWGEIDAAKSSYTVTLNKVELKLVKKSVGKWPQLKRDEAESVVGPKHDTNTSSKNPSVDSQGSSSSSSSTTSSPETKGKQAVGPSYPTSSRNGPKNWDKIAADAEEDDDGLEDESAGVNHFFKNLYKNATPEQQRAMMKSFTESNGTSLSTDWNDVKGRTVETVPPEGMEAKKF
ncbi:hypothetical protein XA68_12356 [Ophiocordyceps unilateralis]|uniref:CS domain-containing protein n=1 Tax=Ophiocordyceps unilateralis TaxID=268505 RepID=A0A2A9PUT4_OPHUN|nr:hypothetical protein XA68_12356 [Ophiocordyceps unilateralis]